MTTPAELTEKIVAQFQEDSARLRSVLESTIVGQSMPIGHLLTAVLAGGHVLMEGLPGLGKTHLALAMANSMGAGISRIQCTPDLMPADITGSEILFEDRASRDRSFEFRPGPVFSSIVLVDEINRAPPKTQAALLEAMQEGQVTCAGTSRPLPAPFWVLATQNTIELEGTYPLPEAQLDRFLFKIAVHYPERAALLDMIDRSLDSEPARAIVAPLTYQRVQDMMALARQVIIAAVIREAAVDLVLATQPDHAASSTIARSHFSYGASPRALQAILRAARVHALADGRVHVALDDLAAVALPALRHRVQLTVQSELDGLEIDNLLKQITQEWSQQTLSAQA